MSNQETLPYSERSILVLGGAGANSIGRATVDRFHQLGARDIYIGTTSWANFGRVIEDYADEGLPTNNLHPFVSDVTDKKSLEVAARVARTHGQLTDVVFGHAGGMDHFLRQLIEKYLNPIRTLSRGRSIYILDEGRQAEIRAIIGPMYQQIKVWREESIPHGIDVNFTGTFNAREVLLDAFPDGFTGVFINSTWGHLSGTPGVEIPLLYGPVDIPKAMVRDRLRADSQQLYQEGTPMAELIASLVKGTRVGKMFQDYLMLISDPEQAAAIRRTAINPIDVVTGIELIIETSPDLWPNYHQELFVTGDSGEPVFGKDLGMSAMYSKPYPY